MAEPIRIVRESDLEVARRWYEFDRAFHSAPATLRATAMQSPTAEGRPAGRGGPGITGEAGSW